MGMVRWILVIAVVAVAAFFVYVKFYNVRPADLGVNDGLMKVCPSQPNCVSSQSDRTDPHFIEPIIYNGDRKEVQLAIESFLLAQGNAQIVSSSLGYVHLEIKSKLMGYIDDVEFYLPEADSAVHVRSASRVGYSDLEVNRQRVEQVREHLNTPISN
ncbi:DUF1499 domain-containing protein [Marinomonas epiphytica]